MIADGVAGNGFTVIVFVEAALVLHELVAVTLSVPLVEDALKLMETELPDGVSVAPVPEYDQLKVTPATLVTE